MSEKDRKIIIGSDHAGFNLKESLKEKMYEGSIHYEDIGTYSESSMDYPDVAHPLAQAVSEGKYNFGILICGTGIGMSMSANRHKGVRAALCWDIEITRLARQHNDANILCMPGRYIETELAWEMVKIFYHQI